MTGSDSVNVPYRGTDLRSGQRCWWDVRVWDREDLASLYSEPAWWEMGLLNPDDWHADWIGLGLAAADHADPDAPTPGGYLRTTFQLDPSNPVRSARLYATRAACTKRG